MTSSASYACPVHGFKLWLPIERLSASAVALYDDARFPGRCILVLFEHQTALDELDPSTHIALSNDMREAGRAIRDVRDFGFRAKARVKDHGGVSVWIATKTIADAVRIITQARPRAPRSGDAVRLSTVATLKAAGFAVLPDDPPRKNNPDHAIVVWVAERTLHHIEYPGSVGR